MACLDYQPRYRAETVHCQAQLQTVCEILPARPMNIVTRRFEEL